MSSFLFHPAGGRAADFIPFWREGRFHLFYLRVFDAPAGRPEGTPWHQVVTRDFVSFEDWGEAIPCGAEGTQDAWIFTGSIFERDGLFHAFYTGHNRHFGGDAGGRKQGVMLATSRDLRHWEKDPSFETLYAPPGYEPDDWRDPFIFRDERRGEFGMLLAARLARGPSRHRGCLALLTSRDLREWTVREPFWAPDRYRTHECPDLFRIGDWWYLVYSTFSESFATHYRMSRTLDGQWLPPDTGDGGDALDGRAFYAAKTAGDGSRRYAFGWLPTRDDRKDDTRWNWGGTLVVHEIVPQPNGTLGCRMPASVREAFTRGVPVRWAPVLGEWFRERDGLTTGAAGRFSAGLLGEMPDPCLIEATVRVGARHGTAGLILRAGEGMERSYQLRLEPGNGRLVFDRWPRPGDQPHMIERPLGVRVGEDVHLRVLVDGSCMVAYANDRVALSCRMYEGRTGEWGVFAADGPAGFADLACRCRATQGQAISPLKT